MSALLVLNTGYTSRLLEEDRLKTLSTLGGTPFYIHDIIWGGGAEILDTGREVEIVMIQPYIKTFGTVAIDTNQAKLSSADIDAYNDLLVECDYCCIYDRDPAQMIEHPISGRRIYVVEYDSESG
jgi:hypothetical protein